MPSDSVAVQVPKLLVRKNSLPYVFQNSQPKLGSAAL
jgi:hypothetical protein